MGVGLTQALISSRTSMNARTKELSVLGQNVANTSTDSYHRQSVVLESGVIIRSGEGFYGTGVKVTNVTREFNSALEGSLQGALSDDGFNKVYSSYLEQAETLVSSNENSPLSDAIQTFAADWQSVATSPEDSGLRSTLLSDAENVADIFNQEYQSLSDLKNNLAETSTGDGMIQTDVDKINTLLDQIISSNREISAYETLKGAQQANDLRDQRDALVSELSSLVDVSFVEKSNHAYEITVAGHVAIDGERPNLETADHVAFSFVAPPAAPAAPDTASVTWASDGSAVAASGGELLGAVEARAYIQSQMADLADFATTFAGVINTAHAAGWDLQDPAVQGAAMFDATTAGAMTVSITDPKLVAASGDQYEKGNGDNALAVWDAMNTAVAALGNNTLLNNADRWVDGIAANTATSLELYGTSTAAVSMYSNAIQEESGVSLDEELSDMLVVQRAYQASAKLMSTINSMMGTVMDLV